MTYLATSLKLAKFSVTERTAGCWQQAKMQQPIGVVGLVIIHVNGVHDITRFILIH